MSRNSTHRLAAWFQVAVGFSVIGWWAVSAVTNGVPELAEGRIDIVFHIVAELSMAWLLIAAGGSVLARGLTPATTMLSGLALGALAYSSINSPGYFAEQNAWWAVVMFGAIGAAAVVTARHLTDQTPSRPTEARPGGSPVSGVRSATMIPRRNTPRSVRRTTSSR